LSGHLTSNQIEDYCRHKLPPGELLSVSDHLETCEPCRQQVEVVLDGDALFFALRSRVFEEAANVPAPPGAETHLTFEQTSEHADGRLAVKEQQWVQDHLASCEQCALAVDDLRIFRSQVAPALNREYHPADSPTPGASGWFRWILFLPSNLLRSPALAFGSVVAVLLLVVAGWLAWQTLQHEDKKPQIAVKTLPDSNTSSPATSVNPGRAEPPAPVIVTIYDGEGRLVWDQGSKLLGADILPAEYQRTVKEALTRQEIEKSSLLAGLSRPEGVLMGGDTQGNMFSVIEPVGKVMLTDRPTFRWSQLAGATDYVVEVFDDKFNLMVASPQLTDQSWTPGQQLGRGRLYSWQVRALKDGREFKSPRPPARQATFRVLDRATADELVQARQSYSSWHLLLGLLYAKAGLLDEAEQELHILQKNNPNSEIAHRLLSSVQATRR